MATVGSLLVVLRADTSPFSRDLGKATNITSSFASAITSKLIGGAAIINTLSLATRGLSDAFIDMQRNGTRAGEAISAQFENMLRGMSRSLPIVGNLAEFLENVSDVGQASNAWRDFADSVNRTARALSPSVLGVIPTGPSAFQREERSAAVDAQIAASTKALAEEERARTSAISDAKRVTESTLTPMERYNASVSAAKEHLAAGRITLETFNRVMADTPTEAAAASSGVEDLIANLKTHTIVMHNSARAVDLYRASQLGAAAADLARVNAIHDFSDSMVRMEQLQLGALAVIESTRTPLEIYEQTIGRLNELLGEGMIAWEVYGRAVREARRQLETSAAIRDPIRSNLIGIGGTGSGGGGLGGRNVIDRTQEQVRDNTKRQLELSQQQIDRLDKIDATIRERGVNIEEISI